MNPPSIVTVKRTSGRVEDDWETQGNIHWNEAKKCAIIRVFKNIGSLEGHRVAPYPYGYIEKHIFLRDFLELNPAWTERAAQVCNILKIPFPDEK